MRRVGAALLAAGLILSACSTGRPMEQRLQIACSSWANVFETAKTRRQMGLSTKAEITAINAARPLLNPVCLEKTLASVSASSLTLIEDALLEALDEGDNQ